MPLVYVTIEQAIVIQRNILAVTEDALVGVLDTGPLEGVLANIQNDDYYPTFAEKLTHLFYCGSKFHCFATANKRTAMSLCVQMLLFNGYFHCVPAFWTRMENIVYEVANDVIDKALLHEIIVAHIEGDEDNEELQLKIYDALKKKQEAAGEDA